MRVRKRDDHGATLEAYYVRRRAVGFIWGKLKIKDGRHLLEVRSQTNAKYIGMTSSKPKK